MHETRLSSYSTKYNQDGTAQLTLWYDNGAIVEIVANTMIEVIKLATSLKVFKENTTEKLKDITEKL